MGQIETMNKKALAAALAGAKEGAVVVATPLLAELSNEPLELTVLENVEYGSGRRVTLRIHWYEILVAQRVAIIEDDKLEWTNAGAL